MCVYQLFNLTTNIYTSLNIILISRNRYRSLTKHSFWAPCRWIEERDANEVSGATFTAAWPSWLYAMTMRSVFSLSPVRNQRLSRIRWYDVRESASESRSRGANNSRKRRQHAMYHGSSYRPVSRVKSAGSARCIVHTRAYTRTYKHAAVSLTVVLGGSTANGQDRLSPCRLVSRSPR